MLINFRYAVMPLSRYNVIYYIIYTAPQALSVSCLPHFCHLATAKRHINSRETASYKKLFPCCRIFPSIRNNQNIQNNQKKLAQFEKL